MTLKRSTGQLDPEPARRLPERGDRLGRGWARRGRQLVAVRFPPHGPHEPLEIVMRGHGDPPSAFGGLDSVGVWDPLGRQQDGAGAAAPGLVRYEEADLALQDVEDLVLGAVEV